MTDRRKFLQLLASACAVAACPEILIPGEAVVEPVEMVATAAPRLEPRYLTKAEMLALISRLIDDAWEAEDRREPYVRYPGALALDGERRSSTSFGARERIRTADRPLTGRQL